MIKFFRKIRKKLIGENQFRKYLIYAIGEIILVVIGILIALQLNNIKEANKTQKVEIEILEGIRSDILLDTIDINYNIKVHSWSVENDSLVLDYLVNKKNKDGFIEQRLSSYGPDGLIIIMHDAYYNQAKQKGLAIISNSALRNRVSKLYDSDYYALNQIQNKESGFWEYNRLINKRIDQIFRLDKDNLYTISNEDYKTISKDENFHYLISSNQDNTKYVVDFVYKSALKSAIDVVDAIDVELKRLKG